MKENGVFQNYLPSCAYGFRRNTASSILPIMAMILAAALVSAAQTAPPTLYDVKVEHVWIPMKDTVRLAADLYVPVGARAGERFPAIFKYDPYRKDDNPGIQEQCDLNKYFAARGYVG